MIRGADFASFQDRPHLERALGEGIRFAFVKLTQGEQYVNPEARWQLDALRAHGVRCGVYHYLDPGVPAAAQWSHFAEALTALPYWRELVVCLDYEAVGATDAEAAAFIAAGRRHGYRVGLYSSSSTHGYANIGAAYRWLASWVPGWQAVKPPRGATFWQWAPGVGGDPDWDVFVGDRAALEAFWRRYSGRRPVFRVIVPGAPAVELGPFLTVRRATLAALVYALRHPRRTGWHLERQPA